NLDVADGLHVRTRLDVLRFFRPSPGFALYRPLTSVGYVWAAWSVLGLDPVRWTLAQLGLHVASAVLVCAIATRLLCSRPAGLATALVYASAPGHAPPGRSVAPVCMTGTAPADLPRPL